MSSQTAPQPLPSEAHGGAADEPEGDVVYASDLPPGALQKLSPARKLVLIGEVLRAYGRARWWLARRGLDGAVAALRGHPGATEYTGAVHVSSIRLGWAVRQTLRWVPTDSHCLMQSLVLTALLSARSIDSSIVTGVSTSPAVERRTWVEYCGRPVLPGDPAAYESLTTL